MLNKYTYNDIADSRYLPKLVIWLIVLPNVGPRSPIEGALYMPVILIKVTTGGGGLGPSPPK